MTQKQIEINIHRLKTAKHTDKCRLSYWLNQKEKYKVLHWKREK